MGLTYIPPQGDNIQFELKETGYTPPDGDDVDFWMAYDQSGYVRKLLVQQYSLRTGSSLVQPYGIFSAHLVVSVAQIYGLRTSTSLDQRYGDAQVLSRWLDQWYGDASQLHNALIQKYDDAYQVSSKLDQPYSLPLFMLQTLEQKYFLAGVELLSSLQQLYNVQTVELVRQQLRQPFSLLDDTGQVITPDPGDGVIVTPLSVIEGGVGGTGVSVGYTHINVESGSDQYCMSCEVHLASQEHYAQVDVLSDLTITIGGDVFEFFVESKQRQRSHGNVKYIVHGLSKTALLDAPYAQPLYVGVDWEEGEGITGMASAIVADLAEGYDLDWNTVDWYIPVDTLMPSDQTPLAIIVDIVKTTGAIVQTEPDGTMTIEPLWPDPIPNWDTLTPAYVLSDALNFFTCGEDYEHKPGYNRYLVGDSMTTDNLDGIRFEEESISSTTKRIRVYQVPWTGVFNIQHTGCSRVILHDMGVEEREIKDEIVEFVTGAGSTLYPIYGVVSYEWQCDDLGQVLFEEDGSLTLGFAPIGGPQESLLKISYQTKCQMFSMYDPMDEQVQLIAEKE